MEKNDAPDYQGVVVKTTFTFWSKLEKIFDLIKHKSTPILKGGSIFMVIIKTLFINIIFKLSPILKYDINIIYVLT